MGFRGVQPLLDYGEQRHAFSEQDFLREPPADADLAVLQAGIPPYPAARQTGPTGAAMLFLNFGYNHGSDCVKIMDAETGRIVHSRDVTWHQPREPLTSPAPTVDSEVPQSPSGAATPEYIYIQPAPAATTAPAAAPVPASDNAAPAPPRNLTEPIRDRVVRELGHEGDVRMPGRTRGETRAMRESPRTMGLMSHAALAQGIATREAFDEAFHEHCNCEYAIPFSNSPRIGATHRRCVLRSSFLRRSIFSKCSFSNLYLCVGDLAIMIPPNNSLIPSSKARLRGFSAALSALSFMQYSQRLFYLLQATWCALPKVTSYIFTLRLRFLALKFPDFDLGQICRGCGEYSTCTPRPMTTPTPAPEMIPSRVPTTSPVSVPAASPTDITTPSTPEPTENECSVLQHHQRPGGGPGQVRERSYAAPPAWTASPIPSTATVSTKHFAIFPQILKSIGLPFLPHVV